jgi:DNA-binding MarR family transcriptional regulator
MGPVAGSSRKPTASKKRSPRAVAQVDVFLALVTTAERFEREVVELLKSASLSPSQYNILRILRGAGDAGLTCGQVGGRLVRHDPDVTRLMDRLVRRGLVERSREEQDRRIVRSRITAAGLELLATLDTPVDTLHERQFGHMSERRLGDLKTLLVEAGARHA